MLVVSCVSPTRNAWKCRPHREPSTAVRRPEPVLGVRRDEDDVAGTQLSDAVGSMQLDLPLENYDRLGLPRVEVGCYALVRLSGHLAEGPPVIGLTR